MYSIICKNNDTQSTILTKKALEIEVKKNLIVEEQVKLRALQIEKDLQEIKNLEKPAYEVEKREKELLAAIEAERDDLPKTKASLDNHIAQLKKNIDETIPKQRAELEAAVKTQESHLLSLQN